MQLYAPKCVSPVCILDADLVAAEREVWWCCPEGLDKKKHALEISQLGIVYINMEIVSW